MGYKLCLGKAVYKKGRGKRTDLRQTLEMMYPESPKKLRKYAEQLSGNNFF